MLSSILSPRRRNSRTFRVEHLETRLVLTPTAIAASADSMMTEMDASESAMVDQMMATEEAGMESMDTSVAMMDAMAMSEMMATMTASPAFDATQVTPQSPAPTGNLFAAQQPVLSARAISRVENASPVLESKLTQVARFELPTPSFIEFESARLEADPSSDSEPKSDHVADVDEANDAQSEMMADKQSTDEMMDTMAIPEPTQDKMDSESAQETAAAEMSNDDRQESAVENTAEAATGSEIDVAAIDSLFEAEEFAMPTAKKTVVATAFGVVAASQLRTPAERKRRRTNRIPR